MIWKCCAATSLMGRTNSKIKLAGSMIRNCKSGLGESVPVPSFDSSNEIDLDGGILGQLTDADRGSGMHSRRR
jgi:hypothetical protein